MFLAGVPLDFDWLATVASAWLLNYVIHSTVLLTLVWVVSRRSLVSPGFQDVLWKTALVGGLVTATVAGWGHGPLGGTWLLSSEASPVTAHTVFFAPGVSAAPAAAAAEGGGWTSWIESVRSLDWRTVLLTVWLTGAGLGLLLVLSARIRLVRALGRRVEVSPGPLTEALEALCREAGVRRPVRLTLSDRIGAPVALGHSEICLPPRAVSDLDPEQQRNVLAHELAHLVRRDPTWRWVGTVLERLFFFQPLNRVARNGMNDTAEFLCDDWAVRRTGQHVTLAKCLLEVAGWLQPRTRPAHVSGMAEPGSPLVRRVERLLSRRPRRDAGSVGPVLAGVGLLLLVAVSAPVVTAVRPALEPVAALPEDPVRFTPPIPVRNETLGAWPRSGDVPPAPEVLGFPAMPAVPTAPAEERFAPAPERRVLRPRVLRTPRVPQAPTGRTFVFEAPTHRVHSGTHTVTFTRDAARIALLHRNLEVIGTINLELSEEKARVFLELLERLPEPPGTEAVRVVPAVEQPTYRMEVDLDALRDLLREQREALRLEQDRIRTFNRQISIRRSAGTPEWTVPGWI